MPQSFLMAKNGSSRTRLFEGLNVDGSNVTLCACVSGYLV